MSTSFRYSHLTGVFRFKGKEIQEIDVSGYRAINCDTVIVPIAIRSTLDNQFRGESIAWK
jgi:hypothetical protein